MHSDHRLLTTGDWERAQGEIEELRARLLKTAEERNVEAKGHLEAQRAANRYESELATARDTIDTLKRERDEAREKIGLLETEIEVRAMIRKAKDAPTPCAECGGKGWAEALGRLETIMYRKPCPSCAGGREKP